MTFALGKKKLFSDNVENIVFLYNIYNTVMFSVWNARQTEKQIINKSKAKEKDWISNSPILYNC